jgi:ribonuclease P protein component
MKGLMVIMQKENRLALRKDFQRVYRFGRSVANHQFVLYQNIRQANDPLRLGISVSKKVGNAVVRNRIRRRIKEIVRLKKDLLKIGLDIILIVRKPTAEMDYHQMEKSLNHIFRKADLFIKQAKGEE